VNTERIIQLITDAVTDAVRERLPEMIGLHAKAVYEPIGERLKNAEAAIARLAASAVPAEALEAWRDEVRQLLADADALRERLPDLIGQHAKAVYDPIGERLKNAEGTLARLAASAVPAEALEATRDDVRILLAEADAVRATLTARVDTQVQAAVAALTLPAGPPGSQGPQGEPGRDATFIPPVPYVPGAEVERGTIVRFEHALWYAHTKTSAAPSAPGSGCTLVLAVPFPDRCEADSSGTRSLVYREAGTEELRVSLGFRPPTYAGVYDATRNYFENESVTYDGSRWVARRDSLGLRPGTDAGALVWTLEVKRGKDGRDGAPGPRGEPGAPGPRGEPGPPGAAPPAKRKAPNGASHD
jgi:hypothetical protein